MQSTSDPNGCHGCATWHSDAQVAQMTPKQLPRLPGRWNAAPVAVVAIPARRERWLDSRTQEPAQQLAPSQAQGPPSLPPSGSQVLLECVCRSWPLAQSLRRSCWCACSASTTTDVASDSPELSSATATTSSRSWLSPRIWRRQTARPREMRKTRSAPSPSLLWRMPTKQLHQRCTNNLS